MKILETVFILIINSPSYIYIKGMEYAISSDPVPVDFGRSQATVMVPPSRFVVLPFDTCLLSQQIVAGSLDMVYHNE